MRIPFDHLDDDALVRAHRESIELRVQAERPDVPPWVRNARALRHDEIVRELMARGLLRPSC